tara:strand:- start:100 stop:324 length:225 start_codon:yes stop_codon:yes gene_type:complete
MNATYGTAPEGTDCDSLDARAYDEAVRYRRRGVKNTSMASTATNVGAVELEESPGPDGSRGADRGWRSRIVVAR